MTDNSSKNKPSSVTDKLDELEKQLFPEPDDREEKIKKVRTSIENGEYQVNPEKIAKKMIDFGS
ncbi:MAG: flagellar biosynthesis anti-sigma factor FlgM, partial [Gammaproteobacteria bacterium]